MILKVEDYPDITSLKRIFLDTNDKKILDKARKEFSSIINFDIQ